jgi:hypothetical protein
MIINSTGQFGRWWVNQPVTAKEKSAMQTSIRRRQPFGNATWVLQAVEKYNL